MAQPEQVSGFYIACRANEFEKVLRLVKEHPLAEIDKMEPNGSTALHAACFYGCEETIRILLDRGFSRRIRNKYGNTAIDECETELKKLFLRSKSCNRFGGLTSLDLENSTWAVIVDGDEQNLNLYQTADIYDGNRLQHGIFHGDAIIQQLKSKMDKIDVIERLFRRAMDERDCSRLIQAHTTETQFATLVNNYLIAHTQAKSPDSPITSPLSEFVDTIWKNRPLHQQHTFQGRCYRAIKVKSINDLSIYTVNTKIINRTFLSATKSLNFAADYVSDRQADSEYTAILTFDIRYENAALDISSLSEFPNEQEVLIMINRVFRVVQVKKSSNNVDYSIELKESKPIAKH